MIRRRAEDEPTETSDAGALVLVRNPLPVGAAAPVTLPAPIATLFAYAALALSPTAMPDAPLTADPRPTAMPEVAVAATADCPPMAIESFASAFAPLVTLEPIAVDPLANEFAVRPRATE